MSSINSPANFGSFIPTTNSWEIQQLQQLNIDPQLKEILIRLYQNMNNMALVVNSKDTGIYNTNEIVTSQYYYPRVSQTTSASYSPNTRPIFRKVVDCGPLPDNDVISIPHNIPVNGGYFFTNIYGTASTGTKFIPIPYSSKDINFSIEVYVDTTNIVIETEKDYTDYTMSSMVLEYMKVY